MDLPAHTLSVFPVDRGQFTTLLTDRRLAGVIEFENSFSYLRTSKDGTVSQHNAIDIIGSIGMTLRALVDGRVLAIGDGRGDGGYWVKFVDLHGLRHYFAHMNQPCPLAPGVVFTAGTVLGELGQTGNAETSKPHLHYQIRGRAGRGGPSGDPAFRGLFPELDDLHDEHLRTVQVRGNLALNPYTELARLAKALGGTRNRGGRWFIPAASSAMPASTSLVG